MKLLFIDNIIICFYFLSILVLLALLFNLITLMYYMYIHHDVEYELIHIYNNQIININIEYYEYITLNSFSKTSVGNICIISNKLQ